MSFIRARLTLYYSLLVMVAILALALVTRQTTRAHLEEATARDLQFRVQAVGEEVTVGSSGPSLPEEHSAYAGPGDGYLLADDQGRLVQTRGLDFAQFESLVRQALAGGARGGHQGDWRWACQLVPSQGPTRALVLVAHNPVEMERLLSYQSGLQALLVPLLALAALLGGWWLAGRALTPLYDLASSARAIGEDSLSSRLPVPANELGDLARAFNQVLQRLEEAFQRQRRFSGDASHELRTPLSVIRAVTSQKLMQPRSGEEYIQALRRIDEAAEHMGKTIESLLFLARREAPSQQAFELGPLVRVMVGEEAKVRLEIPEGLQLKGDPTLMRQLLANLLDNALRHGQPSQVVIAAQIESGKAVLEVADNGLGIASEHLPHLFERFYRVDPARSRATGGSGLGLSICQSIVAAHRGDIRLTSTLGAGTKVTVELPL